MKIGKVVGRAMVAAALLLPMSNETIAEAGSGTATLSVAASVSATCTISTTALSFGTYDPIVANASTALNSTGAVNVTCTSGDSTTITLGQGSNANAGSTDAAPLRRMSNGSGQYLSYSIYQDSGRTTLWGNTSAVGMPSSGTGAAQAIPVYGAVPGAQNVPTGSYSDSIVATVTF